MKLQLLIEDAVKVMQDEGFHPVYVAENKRAWERFLEFACKLDCDEFSTDLCDGYLAMFPDNSNDKTQHIRHIAVSRCIRRLQAIHESGNPFIIRFQSPTGYNIASGFLQAINEFFDTEEESGLSKSSLIKNFRPIKYLFEYFTEIGYTGFADIKHGDTIRGIERMLDEHYSVSSLCTAISGMRRFYQSIQELRKFVIEIPSRMKRVVNIIEVFTDEDEDRIRKLLENPGDLPHRDVAICYFAFETGIRNVDICSLKLSDIEWEHNRINIVQSKTKRPLTLPLRCTYGNEMAYYLNYERPENESEYFFLTQTKPYRKLNTTWGIVCKILEKAGVDTSKYNECGTRMFRHNAASLMLRKGVPIDYIKEELGHSSKDSTMRYITTDKDVMRTLTLSCPTGGVIA